MPAKPSHAIDASALIAYLNGEDGSDVFEALLVDERTVPIIHIVNMCEVYYGYLRADGPARAEDAWTKGAAVLRVVANVTEEFVKRVGRWKVDYDLPLGDAFAAATAEECACPLVTTDHGDFEPVAQAGALEIVWLR